MANAITGILLDLGETVLNFGEVDVPSFFEEGSRAAYEHLRGRGHKLPPFRRYHLAKLLSIRWAYIKSRATDREFDAVRLLIRLHRTLRISLSREEAMSLAAMWYEPISRIAIVEKGIAGLLAEFRDQGIKLGVVSNTFIPAEILDRHLAREGLLDLLPIRVYSCQVGYRKPHRRIFEEAIRRAQVDPARTLFVGDSVLADVRGANRAGLISVLKDPGHRKKAWFFRPRHRIEKLDELRDIVRQYREGTGDRR